MRPIISKIILIVIALAALMLAACGSTPVHYYTLMPPAAGGGNDPPSASAGWAFDLLPVNVPAQVDQPQLVVRQGGQGVIVLQGERWIAPLGDELRDALSANLTRAFGARDVSDLPAANKTAVRIKLNVRRFDSVPGSYVSIEADWNLSPPAGGAAVTCVSRIHQGVGHGYDALVRGHQQAVAQLAEQIGTVAAFLEAGRTATCPSD